ncbi:MAG TPA: fused MFS/spermidine synthase [Planctomycetota bacterium]
MIVELAAVRLLAPWFGTSHTVWSNVIAVILLALAVGYMLGGRLAERANPARILARTLLCAGAWVLWLPWLAPATARALVPEGLALQELAELVSWASLAVTSMAFLPPAALLGTVCPLVVESLARARRLSAGRAGGAVLFASTGGSLIGVFGTSHLLVPGLGVRRTFWLAGALLLACGFLAHAISRGRGQPFRPSAALLLLVLGAGATLTPVAPARLMEGTRELVRHESPYQTVRVVETVGGARPMRFLQVNEGLDSFQSVWQPEEGLLPEGFYYNDFLLPACWTPPGERWDVLVLGLGAGTALRVFERERWPSARFVGIELDPVVVEVGKEYFALEDGSERSQVLAGLDARVALRGAERTFDQVIVDCYANQFEIPAHLCTREFFGEVRARLRPGGWLTANLGGFGLQDPVVSAVAATCAAAFEAPVLLVRVPMSRNYMLLARRDEPVPWAQGALEPGRSAAPLTLAARALPGFARLVTPEAPGRVLTDDRCPIERLQRQSLVEARARRAGEPGT